MKYFLLGLGNKGEEYVGTRHNVGRDFMMHFTESNGFSLWKDNKATSSAEASLKVGKNILLAISPNYFMNENGKSLPKYVKSKIDSSQLIVVYDDLDLPLGRVKLSFGRSSGGHRGVESVIKNLKTKDFIRIRVGVSKKTLGGKLKKPLGEDAVIKYILGKFSSDEEKIIKKMEKKISEATISIVKEGLEKTMTEFNKS